jgi:hypothetical protein
MIKALLMPVARLLPGDCRICRIKRSDKPWAANDVPEFRCVRTAMADPSGADETLSDLDEPPGEESCACSRLIHQGSRFAVRIVRPFSVGKLTADMLGFSSSHRCTTARSSGLAASSRNTAAPLLRREKRMGPAG